MDMVQFIIIAIVIALILATISYYLYQDIKFKKIVENSFNQATADVIIEESMVLTLEGINTQEEVTDSAILQKDVATTVVAAHTDPLFDMQDISQMAATTIPQQITTDNHAVEATALEDDAPPEHSVEAFFANIYKIHFPFANEINTELDFIVDIGFENIKKIKALPQITQFTNKPFKFYVLDKNNQWSAFIKGDKYLAQALKLVVQLVDHEGIISQAQLANIFNELHKFVMQNEAHIYKSDYESAIAKVQTQIRQLDAIELHMQLFLVMPIALSYSDLLKCFSELGLSNHLGIFQLFDSKRLIFKISAENNTALIPGNSYNMLQINACLHKQSDPNAAIEKIFDFAERFTQNFEARLLTSNRRSLEQKDYEAIVCHVKNYTENARLNGTILGGELINRIF